jgi:hypothetical protein
MAIKNLRRLQNGTSKISIDGVVLNFLVSLKAGAFFYFQYYTENGEDGFFYINDQTQLTVGDTTTQGRHQCTAFIERW